MPVVDPFAADFGEETWIADNMLFAADLTCESAVVNSGREIDREGGVNMTISSRNGIYSVQLCDEHSGPWNEKVEASTGRKCDVLTTFVTPWTSIAHRSHSFGNGSTVYLYAWASRQTTAIGIHRPTNITALFCITNYYSQPVTANFTMPNGKVNSVHRNGSRTPFTQVSNFDQIMNGEPAFVSNRAPQSTIPNSAYHAGIGNKPTQAPNCDSQLVRRLGHRPVNLPSNFLSISYSYIDTTSKSSVYMSNVHAVSGVAISNLTQDTLQNLLDPTMLAESYRSALQLMFALAVTGEMVDDFDVIEPSAVVRMVFIRGFKVNHRWARGSQVGLLVVTAMGTVLVMMIRRRACKLDGEPNSLAEVLRLLAASPALSHEMESCEFYKPVEIQSAFKKYGGRYELVLVAGHGSRVQVVGARERLTAMTADANRKPWIEKLWALRTVSGIGFLLAFGGVTVALTLAFVFSRSTNGEYRNRSQP